MLKVAVSEAKGQLTELVKKAEDGEEVVLTRFGQPVARLTALSRKPSAEEKQALMERVSAIGRQKAKPGPCAARSQDFLYGEDGMPG